MALAKTPAPPYHMVVFTSQRNENDPSGYDAMSERMVRLVETMDGYLGHESARGPDGFGITVSYWRDEAAIAAWQQQVDHLIAQGKGKAEWYASYAVRVGAVSRENGKAWK